MKSKGKYFRNKKLSFISMYIYIYLSQGGNDLVDFEALKNICCLVSGEN